MKNIVYFLDMYKQNDIISGSQFNKNNEYRLVLLVSCGRRKMDCVCQARDMYTSERFILSKKLTTLIGCEWYIVSAKYGLLSPNKIIEPYDEALDTFNSVKKRTWANNIEKSLSTFSHNIKFVLLAGDSYANIIGNILEDHNYNFICPFRNRSYDDWVNVLREIVRCQETRGYVWK